MEQYKYSFKPSSSFVKQVEGREASRFPDVQNIESKLYAQIAKGAFKMGLDKSCDIYLQTCI